MRHIDGLPNHVLLRTVSGCDMRCAVVVACSKLTQLQDELSASIERYERAEDRAAKAEKELGTVKVR
jgi:hypothetical protein